MGKNRLEDRNRLLESAPNDQLIGYVVRQPNPMRRIRPMEAEGLTRVPLCFIRPTAQQRDSEKVGIRHRSQVPGPVPARQTKGPSEVLIRHRQLTAPMVFSAKSKKAHCIY